MNIVVTCTKRKRKTVAKDLQFRDIQASNLQEGFEAWRKRLIDSAATETPARELYAGDHWSVVETLEDTAASSGLSCKIWVCSAGYGLISIDAKIKSYSASFSSDQEDTICKWPGTDLHQDEKQLWWQLHTEMSTGSADSLPQSISQVASRDPQSPMLIVASHAYIKPISKDVQSAAEKLADRDLLSIISAGTKSLPTLEDNLLPATAALQQELGGSFHSLNSRLARVILSQYPFEELRASVLKIKLTDKLERAPDIPKYGRVRMTDEDVQQYIQSAISDNIKVTKTLLHRKLRDSGRACEQNRFSRLFNEIVSTD